ncbi:hypothetical protein ACJZ2D_004937 [Fusarium nematophilum]
MKERVRVSESIHFPRHSYRASRRINGVGGYHDVLGRAVLISIVNYLADVADAVEDLKLPTQPEHRARLRMERKKMCDSVVKGANDLTALFDSVKGENKYTDLCRTLCPDRNGNLTRKSNRNLNESAKNLPRFRNEICGQLLNPLRKADATRTHYGRPFSFTPYREKLSVILSGIEYELRRWLRVPRDERGSKHHHRSSRRRRSSSPPPLRSLCKAEGFETRGPGLSAPTASCETLSWRRSFLLLKASQMRRANKTATDAPKTPPTMVVIDAELLVLELAEQMGDSDPVSDAEAEAEVEAEVGTVVLVDESVACGPS